MARVFITGSSDGLGLMAARILIQQGHQVLLHGRHPERAKAALAAAPGAEHAVIGDLSDVEETKRVAEQVNGLGRFDAVIHNAGVGYREPRRIDTQSGASQVFAINVLAPYILTALIERPDRLVYLSSGMHYGVSPRVDDMLWTKRRWEGASAYAESKFYDVALAFAIARLWPEVLSNALEPGWVPTKMGGPGAPDDMLKAPVTQAWLAVSKDKLARYDIFNKREPALAQQVVSEDGKDIPAAPGQPSGWKGVEFILDDLSRTFPDFTITPAEILQDGNKVVVRSELTGTQRAPFMGFPAKNRRMAIQTIDTMNSKLKNRAHVAQRGLADRPLPTRCARKIAMGSPKLRSQ